MRARTCAGGEVVQALTAALFSRDRERVMGTDVGLVVSARHAAEPQNWESFAAITRRSTPAIGVLMEQQAALVRELAGAPG